MNRKTALCVLIVLSVAISMWIHIPLNIDREPTRDLADTTVMDIEYPTRNFWSASDGDLSSESITTFSETLDDDVMHYPDAFSNGTDDSAAGGRVVSGTGSGDYIDTFTQDGTAYWSEAGLVVDAEIHIWFDVDTHSLGHLSYAFYSKIVGLSSGYIYVLNDDDSWTELHSLTSSYAWYNGTLYDDNYWNSTYVTFKFWGEQPADDVFIDYAHISPVWMTLTDSGYAESFAGADDWPYTGGANLDGTQTVSSDGDVLTIGGEADESDAHEYGYFGGVDPSLTVTADMYCEYRMKTTSNTVGGVRLTLSVSGNIWVGATYGQTSTTWTTIKEYIGGYAGETIDSITLRFGESPLSYDGGFVYAYFDYFYIGPSAQMGWGHDGSTTTGLSDWNGEDYDLHLEFETGSGSSFYDTSTNELEGTLYGDYSWVSGKIGSYAIRTKPNPDAGYGRFSESVLRLHGEPYTHSAWLKWDGGDYVAAYPFGTQYTSNCIKFASTVFKYRNSDSTWYQVAIDADGWTPVFSGDWFHIVWTVLADGSITIYVDGVSVGSDTLGNSTIYYRNIGRGYSNSDNNWNGTIDEVQLYDRALSADEVYALYQYGSGSTGSISSDGSEVTLTAGPLGSTYALVADTTTTAAAIDTGYYPFSAFEFGTSDAYVMIEVYDGSATYEIFANATTPTSTLRRNLAAVASEVYSFRLYVSPSASVVTNWAKACGIANHTVTQGSSMTVSDYAYVEGGALVVEKVTNDWIQFNHDIALSTNTNTYNVVNATISNAEAFKWRSYTGSWVWDLEFETRGSITSGTMTDMMFTFTGSETGTYTLSAIIFWTDTTVPVLHTFGNYPNDPIIGSSVVLEIIASDTNGIYSATATPVVQPSGSSLSTISLTYDYTTQGGSEIWSYELDTSGLREGRYTFELSVGDAIHEVYEYLTFYLSRDYRLTRVRIRSNLLGVDQYIPFEQFDVYLNGTILLDNIFEADTSSALNITVLDRWHNTLNSTVFEWSSDITVDVDVYSLKVNSWHYDYVYLNLTRGGVEYSEVITPLGEKEFLLFGGTYTWEVDYRNGSIVSGDINLVRSDALIVTGNTIADLAGYSTTLLEMTSEINVTVSATNSYVLEIQINLENVNTTINEQLVQVLLNITNTNSTIYSQTVDLLAYLQNVNVTLYEQTATFIIGVFNNHTTIYNQNVEILSTLSAIGSNVTANYISLSSSLNLIDSNLAANFTEIVADLTAISSDVASNYISLSAQLNAIDSSLLSNFTSISATLSMLDSSLLSNFTEVMSTLTAVGSNVTANYLSLSATLSAIDSSLLSNFTSISATLSLLDSSLLSNFTEITSELYAVNSSIGSQFLSVSATLNMIDSSLLSNFTEITSELYAVNSSIGSQFLAVSATLNMIDSSLLSNFTEVVATLSAIDSNITANYLSLAATLNAIDSSLLSNFTSISATLGLIDSNLLSNFTTIVANLTAIDSNITANHLIVSALLTAMQSNITTNHLTIVALLNAVDSSISASEINIVAAISEIPVFRGVTTSELINIISASIGVEWLDLDGDGRPDTVSQPLKDQIPKPQEDLPFWLISIVILLVILAVLIRLGRNLAPTVYRMIKNSRSLNVQLANSKSK